MGSSNDIQASGAIDMSGDPAALASMLRDKCAEADVWRDRAEGRQDAIDRLKAQREELFAEVDRLRLALTAVGRHAGDADCGCAGWAVCSLAVLAIVEEALR